MKKAKFKSKRKRKDNSTDVSGSLRAKELELLLKQKQAELENFRKLTERRLDQAYKSGQAKLLEEMLLILDNFSLISQANKTLTASQRSQFAGWLDGVKHIQSQLEKLLQANYVQEIPIKVGQEFDPTIMDAVKSSGSNQKVKRIINKGYRLRDTVLRPAKVEVA